MIVDLEQFLRRFARERGLIRGKNKGSSIVPLAIVAFERIGDVDHEFYLPRQGKFLATVSQREGAIFLNKDITKFYSASTGIYGNYEVVEVTPPKFFDNKRLVRISARNVPLTQHEPLNWD